MSVSVVKRPQGFTLNETAITANIVNLNEFATVSDASHMLSTGDYVYIKSDVINYNGLWYVDVVDVDNFRIREYPTSDNVADIRNAVGATYWVVDSFHGVQCVHLPIVYKLSNIFWPTNSFDSVTTISSVTDSNGYCALSLAADIKVVGNAAVLEYVIITNAAGDGGLNGVYQIVSYTNDTTFVIDCDYSSANDTNLTGASIQYYYNNYAIKVRVYAGLPADHVYNEVKPFELITELKLNPDLDNTVTFSINEYIKSHIIMRNELMLGTLPNNLDFWTNFYIEYAESYDDSDGSSITTTTTSYVSDATNFTGMAVNAKLPFKNRYAGHMSEYLMYDYRSKFLTLFTRPTVFSGKFFDLSFIIQDNSFYDSFENPLLSQFLNTSSGTSWTTGATPSVVLTAATQSKLLYGPIEEVRNGSTLRFEVEIQSASAATASLNVSILNSSLASLGGGSLLAEPFAAGLNYKAIQITGNSAAAYVAIRITEESGVATETFTIHNYKLYPLSDTYFSEIVPIQNNTELIFNIENDGVYRIPLEDPSCNDLEQEIVIHTNKIIAFKAPSLWDAEPVAWTAKGWNYFEETFTPASAGTPGASYFTLPVDFFGTDKGQIVEFDLLVSLSGTVTYASGSAVIRVFLVDGGGGLVSNIDQITLTSNTAGTTELIKLIPTSTAVSMRVEFVLTNPGGAGSSTIRATLPTFYYVRNNDQLMQPLTYDVDCSCLRSGNEGVYLTWLNYLGGFDYWWFGAETVHEIELVDNNTTENNILPQWPNSYGEFADTIRKETFRTANEVKKVRSQYLTVEKVNAIKYIRTSPIVQIVNSRFDRRTVLVDRDSFVVSDEGNKQHTISFKITYTDPIPSQA